MSKKAFLAATLAGILGVLSQASEQNSPSPLDPMR
jgi:hypothetical protein